MIDTQGVLSTTSSSSTPRTEDIFVKLDKGLEWDGRNISLFWPATIQMDLGSQVRKNSYAQLSPMGGFKHAAIADRARFAKIEAITQLVPTTQQEDTAASQNEINNNFEADVYSPCSQIEHFCQIALQKIPTTTTQEKKEQRKKVLDIMGHLYGYLNQLQSAIDSEHPTETSPKKNELTIASKVSVRKSPVDVDEEGCFAEKDITAGEKIGEYDGDIVFRMYTKGEEFIAFKIGKKSGDIIFLEEDKHVAWTNVFLGDTHYEIGISGTTLLKKLNHSPTPNCALWVLIDGKYKDKKNPEIPWEKLGQIRVDVQALSDIKAGQEIFFDYRAESKKQPINFEVNLVVKPTSRQIAEARSALNKSRNPLKTKIKSMPKTEVIKAFNQQLKDLNKESRELYNNNKSNPGFCEILKDAVKKGVPLQSILAMEFDDFQADEELWDICMVIWSSLKSFNPILTEDCNNALLYFYSSIKDFPEDIGNKIHYSIQIYWHLSKMPGTWQEYVKNDLICRRSERCTVKRTATIESTGAHIPPRKKAKRAREQQPAPVRP